MGELFLNFLKAYKLYIINGRVGNDSDKGDFTFVDTVGCSVIDYFASSADIFDKISNFKIDNNGFLKHLPLILDLQYQYSTNIQRESTKDTTSIKFSFSKGDSDRVIYRSNLEEKIIDGCFEPLDNSDINDFLYTFENLILACSEHCKKTIKHTKRTYVMNKFNWYDNECETLKRKRNKALHLFRNSRSDEDLSNYLKCKKSFNKMIIEKKTNYHYRKIQSIENVISDPTKFWKEIKLITNPKNEIPAINIESWFNHFYSLFNDIAENETQDQAFIPNDYVYELSEVENVLFNCDIIEDEIYEAVKNLNIKKSSAGFLTAEHFVYGIDLIMPYILRFFNRIYNNGEFPDIWSKFIIIPIHKKGSKNNPDNYRGIALLEILSKIYISILNKRLTFYVNAYDKLSEAQAGFRAGYSTIDNAFILQAIISRYLGQKGRKFYVAFIDFRKAFDSVHRNILFETLYNNGIKGKLLTAIKSIYKSVKACVRHSNICSDDFFCPVGLRQGCNLSPCLFALFINELADVFSHGNCNGIQIHPDTVQIFLLMFADDVALLADTVNDLQKKLNLLHLFCIENKLTVNAEKTKNMIFKRGGKLARNEKWYYNNIAIDIVSNFTYVGVNFTSRLSFYKMAEAMSCKAKRVLVSLLSSLYCYSPLPYKTFFTIFDSKISSVLMYGSEIWGLEHMQCVEYVHTYACKRFASAPLNTCNAAIMGECGRLPLIINSSRRCLKYWFKILNMPEQRFVRKCYLMLRLLDNQGKENWVTKVRKHLYQNGFGYVWENQGVRNEAAFIREYTQRLKDQYIQNWRESCQTSSKLSTYVMFKQIFECENYFHILNIKKFRYAFVSLRCSSHKLMIEKGRYSGTDRNERFCYFCKNEIEDEFHFVLRCPLYKELRERYIPRKYFQNPSRHHFTILMSCKNEVMIKKLATYIYHSFQLRKEFMHAPLVGT